MGGRTRGRGPHRARPWGAGGAQGHESLAMDRNRANDSYKRGAAVIVAVTIVVAGFMLILGIQTIQRLRAVENHWSTFSNDAVEASNLLHAVSVQMGYGGYIHHFKNFVLRRDPGQLDALTENRIAVEALLEALDRHVITSGEKAALADILATFDKYTQAAERAGVAFERGLSSVEVDILTKVDDTPAEAAFAVLENSFRERQQLAQEETQKALETASSTVLLLLVVVPVVVLLGMMLVVFLRRIVDGNARLAELRDELESLLRQAPDAILHVEQNGAIVRVNDQAVRLFGYPREEFLKLRVEDLLPYAFRHAHTSIRTRAFDDMSPRPIGNGADLQALTKDGRVVPVEISLNFSQSGGRRIATAIVRDITERKLAGEALKEAHDVLEKRVQTRTAQLQRRTDQLEAEIKERRRAENQLIQSAKMATIGQMASGITHELNQPMNIMRMGVEAAQIRIQRGQVDIAMLSETLRKVEDQIVRMSDIITHMRAYSRLDTEGQVPFDPALAVAEGCKLFSAQLQGDDIDLDVSVPAGVSPVMGHANRLEQVILNLLSNARDAIKAHRAREGTFQPGRIGVSVREDAANGNIIILVEDTGGGVPRDVLPHIFAPFVTTKESGRGTGLGLSISFGIVEGMGGTIEVMNVDRGDVEGGLQRGARFAIQLPVATKADLQAAAQRDAAAAAAGDPDTAVPGRAGGVSKILVVDDEVGAAHSLSDFLQEVGYLVYTAYNGEEALQLFDSDPVDAVITDLRMPAMSGGELAKALQRRKADLPIFIMTGQGGDDREVDVPPGITAIWRKPISLSDVARHLKDLAGA